MIEKLFDVEGPVFGVLDKLGQLILLSVMWLIGCIPVVTVFTASSALYYAVCKSVRHGQGSAVREFWQSYGRNLGRGIAAVVLFGALACAAFCLLGWAQTGGNTFCYGMAAVCLLLLGFVGCLLGPVLSRFRLSFWATIRLTCLMAMRSAVEAGLLLVGTAVLALLQFRLLPIPMVLILPGAWAWVSTFPAERALRRFMPPREENDNAWYYEN